MLTPRHALLLILIPLLGCVTRPSPPPAPAPTRDGRWLQDIDYLVSNLKRLHKDPFRHASEGTFDTAHAALRDRVADASDAELAVGLATLIARLGDAHTRVVVLHDSVLRPIPLEVWRFSDGYHVARAVRGREDLLGQRVVAVEGVPVAEVVARLAEVIPHENEYLLESRAAQCFRYPELFAALGISPSPDAVRLVLEDPDGTRRTVRLVVADEEPELVPIWEHFERPEVITERHPQRWYWYAEIPGTQTLLIAYNKCRDDPERPMSAFVAEVFERIDAGGIERVVLDLRRNGGGNQLVAWPLLKGLARRDINEEGRLFALIGLRTFSSALNNAIEFRRWTDGILIGEPTGQKPNHFGEIKVMKLPNSGLLVSYSTNYFTQLPDDPITLEPDIRVPASFADWKAGRDAALDAALSYE